MVPDPTFTEVLPWLKTLPLAPEYRPTLAEFQDPIAYILRIEQEASRYGICKIVPPLPAAPKSTAVANLNLSFCARSPSGDPTFTTRQQQIGFCPRRLRPVQKSVWQSGNRYTLPQFEAKARSFERSHLRKSRKKKKKSSSSLSPLEVESLFWKVATDKPSSVEYANDMPGSGFAKLWEEAGPAAVAENVGETAWNMRGVARAKGSLLRFMREEIPGVTSPMVYVAMMFSWFAWHVEDHDLHSLNYLHMGAGKTWYGVPRDAAQAFEEVVRVHGYGGEVNPLITFATLAEKTTLMSPEVLIGSGIPCCRLVQNAGEFVITFPGSYHSGFSHGFNCGEASNIATPEWLKVAKEAAIRRASTNCPPMVSHYQLLYALALSLCLRTPNMVSTPKSSRLKNKHRCVGETMIKEAFVQNVMRNNDLLNILIDDDSSCVILPKRTSDDPLSSSLHLKLQMKVKPRIALGLCHGEVKKDEYSVTDLSVGSRTTWARFLNGFGPAEENSDSLYQKMNLSTAKISVFESSEPQSFSSKVQNYECQNRELQTVGVFDQGLLSCVTCGILSYACVAIIQPKETAAGYLMSANSNSFANQTVGFEEKGDLNNEAITKMVNSNVDNNLGNKETSQPSVQVLFSSDDLLFDAKVDKGDSALALLASTYGDLSDSEEDSLCDASICADGNDLIHSSQVCNLGQQPIFPIDSENIPHNWLPSKEGEAFFNTNYQNRTTGIFSSLSKLDHSNKAVAHSSHLSKLSQLHGNSSFVYACEEKMMHLPGNQQGTKAKAVPSRLSEYIKITAHSFSKTVGDVPSPRGWRDLDGTCEIDAPNENLKGMMIKNLESSSSGCYPPGSFSDSTLTGNTASTVFGSLDDSINNSSMTLVQTSDKNSSRMHVFCLEHAVEVEKQLRALGGVNLILLCHPEYPKIESEAKHLAEELGLDHQWKDIHYRDASEQDTEKIRIAIEDEAVIPCNGDWAVKLGINLYYSVNLSQSPLFRKQMPYNEVIYKSFSQKSAVEHNRAARIAGRRKKIILAGKWCGKVWMSNQVHPYLADQNLADDDETEPSSEPSCYRGNGNREIIPRSLTNKKAADRRKCDKKLRKSAVKSTRKPARSRIDNSSDSKKNADYSGYAGNAVGEPDTDRSEADLDNDSDKIAILPARNSANSNAAARKKFDKRKVSAVRSSTMKPGHTRLEYFGDVRYAEENSGYAKKADGEPNADRSESDTDIEDGKQVILSRRKTSNYTPSRRKSDKKRKRSAVWSSTRKPAHTRLEDSSGAGCADENSGNAGYDDDDDQNRYESSEADTGSELKKVYILPRRNLTSNSVATKENPNSKKRSNVNCTRKAAHTKRDSSTKHVYIEGELSVKCGKSLSCLRSPLKGINGEPSNILLRKRRLNSGEAATILAPEKCNNKRKMKKALNSAPDNEEFPCDIEGCSMSLRTKQDLNLHKRNVCPEKGCGKKFFSHKYLLQHRKVHSDDRPLRCPWKGCKMTFKWAWARTEHIRVHTGERPYLCKEPGCNLTFRFVSDFSRHRRKTGH